MIAGAIVGGVEIETANMRLREPGEGIGQRQRPLRRGYHKLFLIKLERNWRYYSHELGSER